MKKLLILTTLLCLISFSVFANSEIAVSDIRLAVNGVTVSDFQEGYSSIEASFKNDGEDDTDVTVILAEYTDVNGNLKMNGVGAETKSVPAGKTVKFYPGVKVNPNTSVVKYFAYASKTLQPIKALSYVPQDSGSFGVDNTPCEPLKSPVVCNWANNKTAAVSITIDDGNYKSAVKYNELLKTYGIRSTQFLIVNKITDIDGWKVIFNDGYMDVGNHSAGHEKSVWQNLDSCTDDQITSEITEAKENLIKIFPGMDVLSFATPWGRTPVKVVNEIKIGHYANRNAGGGVVKSKTPANFFKVPACVVQYGTELSKLNGDVDTAISNGGWCVELLHGIGGSSSASGDYSSNYTTIEEHFKYIKQKTDAGDTWPGSFNDVVKYIYERDSAKAEILWSTNSSVGIKVTDGMADDELFDYPLTFKVNLPKAWSGNISVTQNGKSEDYTITEESGKKYAYVNIVPDGGIVVIN